MWFNLCRQIETRHKFKPDVYCEDILATNCPVLASNYVYLQVCGVRPGYSTSKKSYPTCGLKCASKMSLSSALLGVYPRVGSSNDGGSHGVASQHHGGQHDGDQHDGDRHDGSRHDGSPQIGGQVSGGLHVNSSQLMCVVSIFGQIVVLVPISHQVLGADL
jgi:hypothetical protein